MVTDSRYRYMESVAVRDSKYAKQGGFSWQCCTLGQFFGAFDGRLKGGAGIFHHEVTKGTKICLTQRHGEHGDRALQRKRVEILLERRLVRQHVVAVIVGVFIHRLDRVVWRGGSIPE